MYEVEENKGTIEIILMLDKMAKSDFKVEVINTNSTAFGEL